MSKLIITALCLAAAASGYAQNSLRTDGAFTIGDGKLYTPRSVLLGPSLNFNIHFNYVAGAFFADFGIGALFINDRHQRDFYSFKTTTTELFGELPVGAGAIIDLGGSDLVLGGEVALLYNGASAFYELSPHLDILWGRRIKGDRNGLTFKFMLPLGGDGKYEPRYFGLGYKVMYGSSTKKAAKHAKEK